LNLDDTVSLVINICQVKLAQLINLLLEYWNV